MKWTLKPYRPHPTMGTRRTVTKFLWFPKCISRECRWLERATWTEENESHGPPLWVAMWWST